MNRFTALASNLATCKLDIQMGNFLDSQQEQKGKSLNKKLIQYLKDKNMNDISDLCQYIVDIYPGHQIFTEDEFNDSFGSYFNMLSEDAFNVLNVNGQVDLYESLALISFINGDDYDLRIDFIFQLFDFDKSGQIEKKEFVLSSQALISSLCKIANLNTPSLKQLEDFSSDLFQEIDQDKSKTIDLTEIKIYLKSNYKLQDFFYKYADVQTFENAKRNFTGSLLVYQKLFDKITKSEEMDANLFREQLVYEKPNLSVSLVDKLLKILKDTSKYYNAKLDENKIHKKAYYHVMKAMCSFDACDTDNSNTINLTELKFLIFCFEDDQPDGWKLALEMERIDKSKDQQIQREEWLEYLCCQTAGLQIFKFDLREIFDRYDVDETGTLDTNELVKVLTESLQNFGKIYLKGREIGEKLVEEWVLNTMSIYEFQNKTDSRVSWYEFKIAMEKFYATQKDFAGYLDTLKSVGKL